VLFDQLQPKAPSLEVLLRLSSVCVSLFASAKQLEIAYLAIQQVHVEYATETVMQGGTALQRTTMEVSAAHFQVDSSQVNARYPVMMASRAISQRTSRAKRMFRRVMKERVVNERLEQRVRERQAQDQAPRRHIAPRTRAEQLAAHAVCV